MAIIPKDWMPNCAVKRVICHWTAGAHEASSLDKAHYHILIERNGNLVRGINSIQDNVSTGDGRYVAHTKGLNTGSIGVSACCMANAKEKPFDPGPFPLTMKQWRIMAQVVAELCQFYSISVTPQTALGHGEVESILGVRQAGKWDPMVLPWSPGMSKTEVGNLFRSLVKQFIETGLEQQIETTLPEIKVVIRGEEIAGVMDNEGSYVKVAPIADKLEWQLLNAAKDVILLLPGGRSEPIYLPYMLLDTSEDIPDDATEAEIVEVVMERGYVEVRELASELGAPVTWNDDSHTVIIGDISTSAITALDAVPRAKYTVRPGDTLSAIAARLLGDGNRWREILKGDGKPFTEKEARRIQLGTVVFLPSDSPDIVPVGASPGLERFNISALVEVAPNSLSSFARNSIPLILAECKNSEVTNPAQIAYVLATSQHESACGKFMVEIWGPTDAQRRYEGRSDLGNIQPGDGFRFRGRGYAQITGRANYETWSRRLDMDLISNPDIVYMNPEIAAGILVQGMLDGSFRPRHKLDKYIKATAKQDFFNAREIINADKNFIDKGSSVSRGQRIAEIARNYFIALGG